MKQLTVRGFDKDLERRIRQIARERRLSLNRAVLELLRRGAGQVPAGGESRVVGDSLDRLVGCWSREEEAEFLRAIEPLERVDPEVWR